MADGGTAAQHTHATIITWPAWPQQYNACAVKDQLDRSGCPLPIQCGGRVRAFLVGVAQDSLAWSLGSRLRLSFCQASVLC